MTTFFMKSFHFSLIQVCALIRNQIRYLFGVVDDRYAYQLSHETEPVRGIYPSATLSELPPVLITLLFPIYELCDHVTFYHTSASSRPLK